MSAQWKTLAQVAEYLQLSEATIYKLKESGKIRGYRVGRNLRFDLSEVDADIKKGGLVARERTRTGNASKLKSEESTINR